MRIYVYFFVFFCAPHLPLLASQEHRHEDSFLHVIMSQTIRNLRHIKKVQTDLSEHERVVLIHQPGFYLEFEVETEEHAIALETAGTERIGVRPDHPSLTVYDFHLSPVVKALLDRM